MTVTYEALSLPEVVHSMASQAATICGSVLTILAISSFVQTSLSGAEKDPYTEWAFDYFFTEDGAVLDPPAVLPVAYEIASRMLPLAGKNLCLPLGSPMSVLLDKLQECSQHELSLRLINTSLGSVVQHIAGNIVDIDLAEKLHNQETVHDAIGSLTAVMHYSESKIKENVMALLHKVFHSRHVDRSLAGGYCSLLRKESFYEYLWDMINKTWQNYSKVQSVAFVGAQLAGWYDDPEEKQKFEELMTDAEWGKELGKLRISFQDVFRTPSIRKEELLRTLVQNPHVKIDLILKYCRSFQLNSDTALQLYIEALLQNSSASHDEEDSVGNAGTLSPSSVVARATEIIPLLGSTNSLVINLNAMLFKIDPYDYETIESLVMIIEKAGGEIANVPLNQALMLIEHLKSYKRTSTPGDPEHQYAFKRAIPLSPAAQTRLPFHLIFFKASQCFWKIITPELNEESFPKIFLISKIMKVPLDTLYMCAADRAFQERLKPKILERMRRGSRLVADKETAAIVGAIQSYLLCITNLERSAALAHTIARDLQSGPIKVVLLKFCISLAEKWLAHKDMQEESREKARIFLQKIQVEYRKRATEAVLMAHKLNSEEHWKLTGKPARLLVLLYQHSTITERFQNPAGSDYPDIHAAAREIAKINDLDMKKIWDALMEKWLCSDEAPADKRTSEMVEKTEDEAFKRLVYVLQLQPVDKGFRILYECAVSTTSPIGVNQLTFAQRSIALKCLIYLADSSAVELLFRKPIEAVRIFLKALIYLSEFEILNIPYTYESFHKAPKEGVIKGLWKNHSHDPRAVKLVTELSLEYQVWDAQLWNGLLQKLLDFNMLHVHRVLVNWRHVVHLSKLCCSHLDVTGIAKKYTELQLLALSLGCLWLIPQPEKRDQQIKGFLASHQPEKILHQIKEHMGHCGLACFASEIRYLVLEFAMRGKCFVGTEYLPYLKLQEMGADRLKGLVKYLADENR
ncbi:UNVERIFIED_CONTAM: hypothetical protein K2H54_006511 [Gekko kuhli]